MSAAAYLYELGAVEGPAVEARMTALAPLLSTLGMDLPIARFMILGAPFFPLVLTMMMMMKQSRIVAKLFTLLIQRNVT